MDAHVPIVTAQVQYSLLDRRAEAALVPLCHEKGVRVIAYGTLAGGLLSDDWLHQPEPPVRCARCACCELGAAGGRGGGGRRRALSIPSLF